MSGRAGQILGRFPAHFEASRPGKQLSAVVEAIAGDLDLLSADLAAVRRAHRIGHADMLRDVLLLGGLHGLTRGDLSVLFTRVAHGADLAQKLEQAIGRSSEDRNRWAEGLFDLWGIDMPRPRLPLFAPVHDPEETPDLDAAARALVARARGGIGYRQLVEAARRRVVRVCQIHAGGNGTVRALLEGAANALDLEVDTAKNATVKEGLKQSGATGAADALNLDTRDEFFHSQDLFWHSTFVRDRAPLTRTVPSRSPAHFVRMPETIAASELADQMRLAPGEVLARIAELGLTGIRADSSLDLATAERVAGAFGFTVERYTRGAVRMERTIAVAALATQMGIRVEELLARLAALGAPGLDGNSAIQPERAAQVARKYGYQVEQTLPVGTQVLGIEENPLRRETYPKEECEHGHLWRVIRRGFGRELLQAGVVGREDKTVGPMVVNRDEGHGVGYFGAVPAGKELVFMEEGRVFLDGGDVTSFAFSWQGACFGHATEPDQHDFALDGPGVPPQRRAAFAVATPEGALDREAGFPHAGLSVTVPGIGIGVTRMAFFVQEAHLSSREGTAEAPQIRRVTPHFSIGFADRSVFAAVPAEARPTPDTHPASDYEYPTAADLHLSWLEHEAYALRVIIPRRFALLDGEAPPITQRVAGALERFRPAGVQVRVEYLDDWWLMGKGFLLEDTEPDDPNLTLRGGTVLWPAPTNGT